MDQIIKQTRCWIESIVIANNFCPFVRNVFQQDHIAYHIIDSNDMEECLFEVIQACKNLDSNPSIETSLLIYPQQFEDFGQFLDFAELAEQLLIDQAYEGIYQLATFHPEYCFAETLADDPANYTNRSPYPMLHLLREESISIAADNYPDIDKIPERNIETAHNLGLEKMRTMLQDCFEKNKPD
jgi:hypothetical protein